MENGDQANVTDPSGRCWPNGAGKYARQAEPCAGGGGGGGGTLPWWPAAATGAAAFAGWAQQNQQQIDRWGEQAANQIGQWWNQLCSETKGELNDNDQKHIGRVDSMPDWFADHPDVAEEAKYKAEHGGQVDPQALADHEGEAQQALRMLDNSLAQLRRIRRSRNEAAQQEIDRAIAAGEAYRQKLIEMLNAGKR